jgi:pyochelin biosynthetic protein PchC
MELINLRGPGADVVCPPRARLLMFHHAGASSFAYASWAQHVDADIDIFGADLPARVGGPIEAALADWDSCRHVCRTLLEALQPVSTVIAGHSMGALLAYEAARLLDELQPHSLKALCVSGCRAPGYATAPDRKRLSTLEDDELLDAVFALGGTSADAIDDDLYRRDFLPVARQDFRLLEAYTPQNRARLSVPLLAFGGQSDLGVCEESLGAWSAMTTGDFVLSMLPGGHFFNLAYPRTIVHELLRYLD